MKKLIGTLCMIVALTAVCLGCFAACGVPEQTFRLEAEYAKVTDGSLDTKDLISNGYYVYPSSDGGFGFEHAKPVVVQFDFESSEACEAVITVCVLSANTFGNEFELQDADYLFYLNDENLGKPDSILDYEGNPTTKIPKEDFTGGSGHVYMSWNVMLDKGANSFAWKYQTGCGAFKFDYTEITGKTEITWTEDHTLVDNFDGSIFPGE